MHRYFIEMAYNGSKYHGWQIQPNAITIQSVVNDALWKALGIDINCVGAGRTDTGVHASYYVAHFDVDNPIEDLERVLHKLNRILHNDIVIYSLQNVSLDLHSRFSATARTYHYYIKPDKNPFLNDLCFRPHYKLDFEMMNEAAKHLLNHTDFTSFSKLHTETKTNDCNVSYAQWEKHDSLMVFKITADRFLRNMVRAIVGTLLDVGRGKLTPQDFNAIITAKDRGAAGTSAQAQAFV